jgi:hypothetical protein
MFLRRGISVARLGEISPLGRIVLKKYRPNDLISNILM